MRLPLEFDTGPLLEEVAAIPSEDWIRQPFKSNYEGAWDVVPLLAAAGEIHPLRLIYANPSATRFLPTRWLDAMPAFEAALARFECPLRSVRLMRLAPGSKILEHCDDLDAQSGAIRLHVPLTTNPRVEFRLGGRPVPMAPGSVWYLRLSEPHSAGNEGTTARIHLVLDSAVNGWLARMLSEGAPE
ncbi:MAG TPA: aspartyl/asparaginyl beta-hydroxylase domain-containing protein [Allosphingosinicella sp.]